MELKVTKKPNGIEIQISGLLTGQKDGNELVSCFLKEIDSQTQYGVLDFSISALPDSRFISRLLELHHNAKNHGIKMYLYCGENNLIQELFRISYLDRIMPLIKSPNDIIA